MEASIPGGGSVHGEAYTPFLSAEQYEVHGRTFLERAAPYRPEQVNYVVMTCRAWGRFLSGKYPAEQGDFATPIRLACKNSAFPEGDWDYLLVSVDCQPG
ncbi:MAG: hypothetical protein HUJ24_09765 [Rhodobacteraceae bacterium]|nr:hypothetical protein [Paracoccaceae bacterium]